MERCRPSEDARYVTVEQGSRPGAVRPSKNGRYVTVAAPCGVCLCGDSGVYLCGHSGDYLIVGVGNSLYRFWVSQ